MNHQACMIMAGHYETKGNLRKARELYEKIVKEKPSAEIHEKIGILLNMEGNLEAARSHFLAAFSLNPQKAKCIYSVAIIERIQGDYESSMERYLYLKKMGFEDPKVDMSLGVLYSELGEMRKALACYESALEKKCEDDILLFNYSLCLMTLGDYRKGLKLYEKRIWHAKPPGDEWTGQEDANVLVSPEQGNGDIVQFSRYFGDLRSKCQRLTLLCSSSLVNLMKGIEGVDEVLEFNPGDEFVQVEQEKKEEGLSKAVPYGRFIRIMSIPYALNLNPPEVKFKKYLKVDNEKKKEWRERIGFSNKVRIGLCWQGGRRNDPEMMSIDRRRSISLEEMASIVIEDADFYTLQKDESNDEFPSIKNLMGFVQDFSDTAAFIDSLDLVISVDTAVAHVSGALGKPTWMLSRKGGCWRWGDEGESTFWYPSMRIFRQDKMNCWKTTLKKVKEALNEFVRPKKGD